MVPKSQVLTVICILCRLARLKAHENQKSSRLTVSNLNKGQNINNFSNPDAVRSLEKVVDSNTQFSTNGTICTKESSDHVHFYLYTADNPLKGFEILVGDTDKLNESLFRIQAPIKILIHGFGSGCNHIYPKKLKDAYLETNTELNVILVDWSLLAEPPLYEQAVKNTGVVAVKTANLALFLISENATTIDKVHIIGHSLGAHVSGIVGQKLEEKLGQKPSRITGLDPAKPLYNFSRLDRRLDKSDADFVDVIHTSVLGLFRTVGTVDFYPNDGINQPGCFPFDLACSHSRAHEFFTDSVYESKKYKACKCFRKLGSKISLSFLNNCHCDESDEKTFVFMGDAVSTSARGIFYLATDDRQQQDTETLQTVVNQNV